VPNHLGRFKLYGSLRWRADVLGTLAAPASVGPWHCTVIGFGLDEGGRDGGSSKLNLYVAPTVNSA